MPTDPSALRALLLTQAKQQQAQAVAEEKRIMAEHGKKAAVPTSVNLSDDDYVFDQATTMLWNPLVGPALRSALYTSEGTDVYLSVTGHHNLPPDPYGS
jgi:hypothetical protein